MASNLGILNKCNLDFQKWETRCKGVGWTVGGCRGSLIEK